MNNNKTEDAKNTLKLLERALDYLVETKIPEGSSIEINKKQYKNINFTSQQVIDAMHELAVPPQKPITSRSNIRNNKDGTPNIYKQKITQAKARRAAKDMNNQFLDMPQKNLSEMEYIQTIKALQIENNELRTTVSDFNSLIKQIELKLSIQDTNADITVLPENNNNYKLILKELIAKLFQDEAIFIKPSAGKVPAHLMYDAVGKIVKICNIKEIEDILDFDNIKTQY